MIKTIILKS